MRSPDAMNRCAPLTNVNDYQVLVDRDECRDQAAAPAEHDADRNTLLIAHLATRLGTLCRTKAIVTTTHVTARYAFACLVEAVAPTQPPPALLVMCTTFYSSVHCAMGDAADGVATLRLPVAHMYLLRYMTSLFNPLTHQRTRM